MSGLNDSVVAWALDNTSFTEYDTGKRELIDGQSQEEIADLADNWNQGLIAKALSLVTNYFLLLEDDSFLLLESGDKIILE
jgi:hypothetical protein